MATPRLGLVVEDKPTELSCRLNTHVLLHSPTSGWPPFLNDSLMKDAFSSTLGPDGLEGGAFKSSI